MKSKAYNRQNVTEVEPATDYFVADDDRQDDFANHAIEGYGGMVAAPKAEKFWRTFKQVIRA